MASVEDSLRVNLLHESHFKVGRLPFKIFPDFLYFPCPAFNIIYSRDGLVAPRCLRKPHQ